MRRAQQVAARAKDSEGNPHPAAGFADIGLAYMRLNQLEPEDAIRLAERGSRLLERSTSIDMMFRAFFVWAEALSLAGRFDETDEVATRGISWLHGRSMGGGPLEAWLWLSQTRNLWRKGRLDQAGVMLERVLRQGLGGSNDDETLGFYESAASLSHALRQGEVEQARQQLAALPPGARGNVMFAIERKVLEAAVHELSGESRLAVEALEDAVELALEGYRYQFSHVGPVIRPALNRMVGRTKHDEFVRSIIEHLPVESGFEPTALVDPLTDREIDVLTEIAAGYTNDEIADRLYISRGTVKRHTSNIYLKLGVHHRAEAAARGRDLGLLA
jgi:ATP/maltotriose-dependent transcriptional regulator MalT